MEELDFTKYSRHLGEGLFADKVVLVLARFARTGELSVDERQTLKEAEDFLSEVIEGSNFTQGVFRSARDASLAKAFTHAVDAIAIRVSSREEFLRLINELLTITRKVSAGEQIGKQDLALVDTFFSTYSQSQFQRSKAMLESV